MSAESKHLPETDKTPQCTRSKAPVTSERAYLMTGWWPALCAPALRWSRLHSGCTTPQEHQVRAQRPDLYTDPALQTRSNTCCNGALLGDIGLDDQPRYCSRRCVKVVMTLEADLLWRGRRRWRPQGLGQARAPGLPVHPHNPSWISMYKQRATCVHLLLPCLLAADVRHAGGHDGEATGSRLDVNMLRQPKQRSEWKLAKWQSQKE